MRPFLKHEERVKYYLPFKLKAAEGAAKKDKADRVLRFYDKVHQAIKIIMKTKLHQGGSDFGVGSHFYEDKFNRLFSKLYNKMIYLETKYWSYLDTEEEGGKWRKLGKDDDAERKGKKYLMVQ